MSKIENITGKIELDAKNEAEKIVSEAKKKADRMISLREKDAKKRADRIIEKASNEAESIVEKALSSAELKARDDILRAKEKVVERVFSMANEKLKNLSEEDYLNYLKKSLEDIDLKDDAVVFVPEKYYKVVEDANLGINISRDEFVDSGFSIKIGKIRYNNEFESLVEAKKDELEYLIVQKLFG